jgi:anti-sigma regulatory factor (Ser/Thr protein kinase)
MVWSRLFPGLAEQVGAARRFVRAVLDGRTETHMIELLVSELATNAVLHTASGLPDGWFVVHVVVFADRVRIRVFDLGGKNVPTVITDPNGDEHGRGLLTVAALAMEWGVEGDAAGRIVWADFPLPRRPMP